MYHRDWLMRQIEMMTTTLGWLLTGRAEALVRLDEDLPTRGEDDALRARLAALIARGRYGAAEDLLWEALDADEPGTVRTALWFYRRLNELPDEALAAGDFPREEIEDGLRALCRRLGLEASLFAPEDRT